MQPVADAEFLDVAQMRIELYDGIPCRLISCDIAFGSEARCPGIVDDRAFQQVEPAPIKTLRIGILLDQTLQLGHRTVQPRRAQWGREMTNGDGTQPALRVHRLARIVDDERID